MPWAGRDWSLPAKKSTWPTSASARSRFAKSAPCWPIRKSRSLPCATPKRTAPITSSGAEKGASPRSAETVAGAELAAELRSRARRPRRGQGNRRNLLRQAAGRRQVQRLCRLRRLPRTAGRGEGCGCGQDYDARPSPRGRVDCRHEKRQARHGAQTACQSGVGSAAGHRDGPPRRRSLRTFCPPATARSFSRPST